jgi:hypothetical protein
MAVGNIPADYVGGVGSIICVEEGLEQFFLIYNDTTATLTNGDVVMVEFTKDVDTTDGTNLPTVATPATATVAVKVGVVNNSKAGSETILDGKWGWVQTKGYCPKISTAGGVDNAEDFLKAVNTLKTAAPDGTSGSTVYSAMSFGISKSADSSGAAYVDGILFGREVTI